jgi:porphobilinogen deaminase
METRLQKVVDGRIDSTIMSAAGLKRLGLWGNKFKERYPSLTLTPLAIHDFIPAAGQGIIALESRPKDAYLFKDLNDINAQKAAELERAYSKKHGGSCRTALAAHAYADELNQWHLLTFHEGKRENLYLDYES